MGRFVLGGIGGVTATAVVTVLAWAGPVQAYDDVATMVFTSNMADTTRVGELADAVGDAGAGAYLDGAGRMTVAVTTVAAARQVWRSGGIPRLVTRNSADLARAAAELESTLEIAGTARWIDPRTNQVVVLADGRVAGADLAEVTSAVAKLGPAARLTRITSQLRPMMSGGDAVITPGGGRCSAGFNVEADNYGFKGLLTAGHCAANQATSTWSTQLTGKKFGVTSEWRWPGSDHALVRYNPGTTVAHPGDVNLFNGTHRDMTGAADVVVGQYVARTGSSTGFREGHVTATNVTVAYGDGKLTKGMVATDACAAAGDSGGPFFSGNTAFGLLSGGNLKACGDAGATTVFQPIKPALATYGVHIY